MFRRILHNGLLLLLVGIIVASSLLVVPLQYGSVQAQVISQKEKMDAAADILVGMMAKHDQTIPMVAVGHDPTFPYIHVVIDNGTLQTVDELTAKLEAVVGSDVPLKIEFGTPTVAESCSQALNACDPVLGATEVQCASPCTTGTSTLNIPAFDVNGNKGYIMSGHGAGATKTGSGVGQTICQAVCGSLPHSTATVTYDPALDGRASDSAFAQLTSATGIDPRAIWKTPSPVYQIQGHRTSDETPAPTPVNMMGLVSQFQSGRIYETNYNVLDAAGYVLINQVRANYTSEAGDSGAPIFGSPVDGPNGFKVYYYGIHHGHTHLNNLLFRIYSPWEGTLSELPLARNFAVTTNTATNSPIMTDSYEGEKRTFVLGNTTYAFYYDGTGIKYKTSANGGLTWGTETSLNTGTLVSDSQRWSLLYNVYQGTTYIYVFYWIQGNPDTQNHHFKLSRGTVSSDGSSATWSSPIDVGYTLANSDCGTGGACAAVVTSIDSTGTLWAVWRYKPGGQSDYYFAIKYSNDGGFNWFDSWSNSDIGSTYPPTMALTKLGSGGMLWAYSFYNTNILYYKIYVPNQGWFSYSTTISGWPTSGNKQISADTNSTTGKAYVVLVSGGTSGSINVLRFSNSGTLEATETPPSGSLSHSLPSIAITPDGVVRIFTIANSKIYETKKVGSAWIGPNLPWGSTFSSPNQLTAGIWQYGGSWKEGNSVMAPYGYN